MGIFAKRDPVGEIETALAQLRHKRDALAKKLGDAKSGCEKAETAWQSALDGDDARALEKAGARLSEAKGLADRLAIALDDHDQQIVTAAAGLEAAKGRAARETKAAILDAHAKALPALFDEYVEVSRRFADELGMIEGVFDAASAASVVRQASEGVAGAKAMILSELQLVAAQLREEPRMQAPPPPMPAGIWPRFGIIPEDRSPHEHPMLAPVGKRA